VNRLLNLWKLGRPRTKQAACRGGHLISRGTAATTSGSVAYRPPGTSTFVPAMQFSEK